jgi:acetolactate synthase-1/2/3 large subunit
MGLGAYPASGAQWIGMLGLHGTCEANMAMHDADLIIAVGARFDDRVTGNLKGFAPSAKIIHIDIDPRSIGKIVKATLGIQADCGDTLSALVHGWREAGNLKNISSWWTKIKEWKARESLAYINSDTTTKAQFALQTLNKLLKGKDAYVVTDVGQNQMWAAQYVDFEEPRHLVTSGGLGTMGFGIPASMGVQMAHPESLVVCICGDGGFQMTCFEMATIAGNDLPVKILLLNNGGLGMVRQWNDLTYNTRYTPSTDKSQPNFVKLAEAHHWTALSCTKPQDVESKMTEWLNAKGPCLLECRIDADENCYPMFRIGGEGHADMIFGKASK